MITTPVLAETGWVVMAKLPVKPTLGTVTLAGTLAIAGLLLERATTAPPSGAGTLRTTVPDESLPPTTLEGLMSRLVRVAGGGAACGVKLRTDDQGPAVPAVLIPRTRQKCVAVESPVVAYSCARHARQHRGHPHPKVGWRLERLERAATPIRNVS